MRDRAMATTADQLRVLAAECRKLAALAKSEEIRQELLETADRFERLAQHRRERPIKKPPAST
jgi:hypothetical protein